MSCPKIAIHKTSVYVTHSNNSLCRKVPAYLHPFPIFQVGHLFLLIIDYSSMQPGVTYHTGLLGHISKVQVAAKGITGFQPV